jgi:hypothetical protein
LAKFARGDIDLLGLLELLGLLGLVGLLGLILAKFAPGDI